MGESCVDNGFVSRVAAGFDMFLVANLRGLRNLVTDCDTHER